MVASLPSQTITGTTAADTRTTTPGTNALVETLAAADTITLSNGGDYITGDGADTIVIGGTASVTLDNSVVAVSVLTRSALHQRLQQFQT